MEVLLQIIFQVNHLKEQDMEVLLKMEYSHISIYMRIILEQMVKVLMDGNHIFIHNLEQIFCLMKV